MPWDGVRWKADPENVSVPAPIFLVFNRGQGNITPIQSLYTPWAPSFLKSRLLGYATIGYIEPRTHYSGDWSPEVLYSLIPYNK